MGGGRGDLERRGHSFGIKRGKGQHTRHAKGRHVCRGGDEPVTALVEVDVVLAGKVQAEHPGAHVPERRDDGSIVIELAVTNRAAFRSWRLGLLDHARVLGPEALVADERAWLTAIVDGAA